MKQITVIKKNQVYQHCFFTIKQTNPPNSLDFYYLSLCVHDPQIQHNCYKTQRKSINENHTTLILIPNTQDQLTHSTLILFTRP